MIEFARYWAFVLAPLPILVWWLAPPARAATALSVPPGIWSLMQMLSRSGGGLRARIKVMLPLLGWLAMVTALAGPFQRGAELVRPSGRDLMIAVDLSASMGEQTAGQAEPRRIEVVLEVLKEFVARRSGDRIGLIGFATEAYLIAPLTHDGDAIGEMLDELTIGLPGRRTDLGRAIGLTVRFFKDQPIAERVLLMVSDGQANAGDLAALDAAALAAKSGITVNLIGFADVVDPLNARHMREVAVATGGIYAEATDAEALAQIYAQIEDALPVSHPDEADRLSHDWTWAPLTFALCIVLLQGWRETTA